LNLELFIAKRISGNYKGNLSRPFINIAVISIALGLAVMIISVAILTGFQNEIRNKIVGFCSNIQVTNYDANTSYEYTPVNKEGMASLRGMSSPGIKHVQVFGIKAGIIKTNDQIQGVILKGVGSDFDWSFFRSKLVEGRTFTVTNHEQSNTNNEQRITKNEILISRYIANKLKLKLNDNLIMYFIQDPPRVRKFKICGIYETGLEDFDKLYVISDIAHIQKLNNWTPEQVSGFEILLNNYKDLDRIYNYVYRNIGYSLNAQTVKQLYPEIFDWLELMDMNVVIIMVVMFLVSGITMISTLLVLILEKTNMIGILKALGIRNISIRQIFLYNAAYIIIKGLIWGNLLALSFCFVQYYYKIIKLPQESYYVSYVPVNINFLHILMLNAGTLILSTLILIIPSYIITRINPVKAITFK